MVKSWVFQGLLVGLGGFTGSVLRFALSGLAHRVMPWTVMPVGTLAVNVAGCLVIGLLGGLVDVRQVLGPEARVFVLIGVLGGFTTFSTFAYETLAFAQQSDFVRASLNVVAQLALGLVAAWLGYGLARVL